MPFNSCFQLRFWIWSFCTNCHLFLKISLPELDQENQMNINSNSVWYVSFLTYKVYYCILDVAEVNCRFIKLHFTNENDVIAWRFEPHNIYTGQPMVFLMDLKVRCKLDLQWSEKNLFNLGLQQQFGNVTELINLKGQRWGGQDGRDFVSSTCKSSFSLILVYLLNNASERSNS